MRQRFFGLRVLVDHLTHARHVANEEEQDWGGAAEGKVAEVSGYAARV